MNWFARIGSVVKVRVCVDRHYDGILNQRPIRPDYPRQTPPVVNHSGRLELAVVRSEVPLPRYPLRGKSGLPSTGFMIVPTQRMSAHLYVDFDGTIMTCDTTDFLFDRFALPAWREIEAEWASGKIGSAECMSRQVDLLRMTPAQLDAAVEDLEIDPGFEDFVSSCLDQGLGISIVSDGLDKVIAATLRRCGLELPYFANHLVSQGSERWRLEFPFSRADCSVAAGHCKCARTTDGKADHFKIVVGDGRSDFCIAGRADLVLAKASLLDVCTAKGLPHLPFRDFHEVTVLLNDWLDAGPTRKQDPQRELLGA